MLLTFGDAGGIALTAAGQTTLTVGFPGSVDALLSELVLIVGQKPATANGGTITDPSGWTQRVASLAQGGYGATLGASTGNTNLWMYSKDAPSASDPETALAVTLGDTDIAWGVILRLDKSEPGAVTWVGQATGENTAGNISHTFAATNLTAGDLILHAMTVSTAISTPLAFLGWQLTQTGSTFGTGNELGEADNPAGNQLGGGFSWHPVLSGSGTGTVAMAATYDGLSTNALGACGLLRARFVSSVAQSAYRFGLDDGNEAGHTFAAAENTPVTVATATRRLLRVQLNEVAGIDSTSAYRLQYRRTDEGPTEWRDI